MDDFFNTTQLKTFPVLYKRTLTGAIQHWKQELNPNDPASYRSVSGQIGGKTTCSEWKRAEAKNPGKKNARTPEQQAVFEIDATYKKKLKTEYHETVDTIDTPKYFKPMLAKKYEDHWHKFAGEIVYSQPKLDGMRCTIDVDGMWSREGEPIVSCPHIHEELKPFFDVYSDLVLDGELYNHEYKDNFDELMSIFKTLKPNLDDLEKSRELGQYHMYDMLGDGVFSDRYSKLKQFNFPSDKLKIVETSQVSTQDELDRLYYDYMERGYEGQIIRIDDRPYFNDRTDRLLKRKEWTDSEFELIRFEEGKGNWAGKAKRAIFKLDDGSGREFGAGVKGSMEYCAKLLIEKDKYVGTMCTVTYCPQRTPAGIPRFPRVKEFDRKDFSHD